MGHACVGVRCLACPALLLLLCCVRCAGWAKSACSCRVQPIRNLSPSMRPAVRSVLRCRPCRCLRAWVMQVPLGTLHPACSHLVHEQILSSLARRDKAKALHSVKPLDGARLPLGHSSVRPASAGTGRCSTRAHCQLRVDELCPLARGVGGGSAHSLGLGSPPRTGTPRRFEVRSRGPSPISQGSVTHKAVF